MRWAGRSAVAMWCERRACWRFPAGSGGDKGRCACDCKAARCGDQRCAASRRRRAIGFLALALGRWHTGPGGLALAQRKNDHFGIARTALEYLGTADDQFQKQGMDPWRIFVAVQQAKALADLQDFDQMYSIFQQASPELERFPVFASHMQEAAGQIQLATKDPTPPRVSKGHRCGRTKRAAPSCRSSQREI